MQRLPPGLKLVHYLSTGANVPRRDEWHDGSQRCIEVVLVVEVNDDTRIKQIDRSVRGAWHLRLSVDGPADCSEMARRQIQQTGSAYWIDTAIGQSRHNRALIRPR